VRCLHRHRAEPEVTISPGPEKRAGAFSSGTVCGRRPVSKTVQNGRKAKALPGARA